MEDGAGWALNIRTAERETVYAHRCVLLDVPVRTDRSHARRRTPAAGVSGVAIPTGSWP